VRNLTRLTILLLLVSAAAGNWTTSGGDRLRSGLSPETGPDSARLLWEGSLSSWFGMPVFTWEDRLVTMRFQSIDYAPVVCHDLATGDTLWTRDFPGADSRSLPIGFRDGRVYAVNFQESRYDTLFALDPDDGSTLWVARVPVDMSISESASYAPDGDLLVTASDFRIARIDCATGDTVWTARRVWPVSGSTDVVAFGERLYAYGGDIGSLYLMAFDVATGALVDTLHIPDTHPGGPLPQAAPMVGSNGTIYAHKVGDNVTAIEDRGDSLKLLWSTELSGTAPYYSAFGHFATGPDGSVYAASWGRVIRLDPETGAVTDSSPFIQDTSGVIFHCRISVGADGTVYVSSDGHAPLGGLYALTPGLDLLWYEPVPRLNTSGPAIGRDGVLAVAGDGTVLRVYGPAAGLAARGRAQPAGLLLAARPNPFRGSTRIEYLLERASDVNVLVHDVLGRQVRVLTAGAGTPGLHSLTWDGRDAAGRRVGPGVYVCRILAGGSVESVRLTLTD